MASPRSYFFEYFSLSAAIFLLFSWRMTLFSLTGFGKFSSCKSWSLLSVLLWLRSSLAVLVSSQSCNFRKLIVTGLSKSNVSGPLFHVIWDQSGVFEAANALLGVQIAVIPPMLTCLK